MSPETSHVPDLLRRFVATPNSSVFRIGSTYARLETNDPTLADTMQGATVCRERSDARQDSEWKLIRDELAPCGGKEVSVLSAAPIGTVLLGPGTVIAVDRDRREVLGFIAPDISGEEFAAIALPLILSLLDSTPNTPLTG
jgi:hypothetical protein